MSEKYVPTFTLNDGVEVPAVGLGTWQMQGDEVITAVRSAIDTGYRHIDTAAFYQNEADIGRAIHDAISAGDVTREELFITSKVWNDQQSDHEVQAAFRASLTNLGLDYLDCYMVHWPCPSTGRHVERFAALSTLQGLGDVRSIAVANYNGYQLREVQEKTGIVPTINQVELHPGFSQAELRETHAQLGVLTEAWSPLAQGDVNHTGLLVDIADKYGVTPAQVAYPEGQGLHPVDGEGLVHSDCPSGCLEEGVERRGARQGAAGDDLSHDGALPESGRGVLIMEQWHHIF